MPIRLLFLGTGTSLGVPVIGCQCAVCTSSDLRNVRTRTSAFLEVDDVKLLIDAGPDLRVQALQAGLNHLDGVLLTHSHADHIGGIDDLRAFNYAMRRSITLYGNQPTIEQVRHQFGYAFGEASVGSTRPHLELCTFDGAFEVEGVHITPLPVMHGSWWISGFRIADLAYITDASVIPEQTRHLLADLDVLVLNALRYEPHPTHFSLQEALDILAQINPRRAYLTHLTHSFDHATVERTLPSNVHLAYDGLTVDLGER